MSQQIPNKPQTDSKMSIREWIECIAVVGPFLLAFIGGPIVIALNLLGITPTPEGMQPMFNFCYIGILVAGLALLVLWVRNHFKNKRLNKMFEQARNEKDDQKRLEICADIVRRS